MQLGATMTYPLLRVVRTRRLLPVWMLAAALAVGWFMPLALAAGTSTTPVPGDAGSARPAATQGTDHQGVLILSGVQYGLPVAEALIGGTVAALTDKGVSINDIYVEMLDLVRNDDPRWRAGLASLLRDKFDKKAIGLVIASNQAALDFLAQEGQDLAPPGTPVLSALLGNPDVAWRGSPRPVHNLINRYDIAGTIRYGLALFPRTRRLLVVAGADEQSSPFFAQADAALAALPGQREIEDTAALSHDEMLQRVSALPPDTLVLLGSYFKDRTGRPFIPVEVAAEVAKRANAPVLALYDAHVREGLTGGSVVPTATVGRRAGEIGFDLLTGVRRLNADDTDDTVPPQPLFDWLQLQRWGADPAKLPADTEFLNRPRTLWNDYRDAVIAASAALLVLTTLVVALAVENRRRKRAQAALGESELRYRTIVDSVVDAIFVLDQAGHFLAVNDHACRQYGYTRDEFLKLHITAIDTPEDAVHAPARLAVLDRDGRATFEARHQDAQGHPLAVEIRSSKILYNGQPAMLSVVRDVTERQRAEAELRESEERFRTLFEETRQPLALMEDGRFIAANPASLAVLRLERPEQLIGHTPGDFSPPCQPDGQTSAAKAAEMIRIACEEGAHEFEWEHVRPDGERFPAIILLTAISERQRTLLHVVWRDISAQKQAQARAEYLAYFDALTGLPNRTLGLDRLTKTLAQAQHHRRPLALLYLDLDRFKHVNDRYGHLQGDRLLQQLTLRLSRDLRAEDTLCRLAADEFMLVLPEVRCDRPLTDLAHLCERLIALGSEPFDLDGYQVSVGLSIGAALYPRDGTDGETLMRHADIALQAAKHAGRQTYRFFEPAMNAALTRFLQTRDDLRAALEREEFVLHYQPQLELETGRLVGVEALVRWQRPGVGLVQPDEFIDVAEDSGLIVPLGGWVLREACRQAAAWRASGWPDLVVAVNISAAQFRHARIGAEVLAVLAATGLAPAGLEVELTESILLEGREAALATVAQWQARGIQLAIDDFGTGYSSLAYLQRFAVDKVKIDRSFILGMAEDDAARAIVQAIIDLARGLKRRTLAEGVEEESLASQLRAMGCDEAQGYLYARPLAAADLERWLRAREVS